MKKLMLLGALVAVAGCSSEPKIKDPNLAKCPVKEVRMVQANQKAVEQLKMGEAVAPVLDGLGGPSKKATLTKEGEQAYWVGFYQTALPECGWLTYTDTFTPVMVRGGMVEGVGKNDLTFKLEHGWMLQEAAWPWQGYDYGYLPPW